MSSIRGVIFDVDGTLMDSNDAHAHAWVEALEEFDFHPDFAKVRRLIGKGGDKLLPELAGIKDDTPEGKRISERRKEIFKTRYLPNLKPFPGVRELLSHMRSCGLKLVVASSAKKGELAELLKLAGASEYMEDTTSSSDAERSKPDPDIVEAALESLGLEPDEVIMIGDTPYDIEAAAKAGIRTIAFRSGGWTDKGLEGAIAIYEGPEDLRSRFDDSHLGSGGSTAP